MSVHLVVPKALELINGAGDYDHLDRVEGLTHDAERAAWGSQYRTMNVIRELMEEKLPLGAEQDAIVRSAEGAGVYWMDAFAPTVVDGYAMAFQGQFVLTLLADSAHDLNTNVGHVMNELANVTDPPFVTIANIEQFPNVEVASGAPAFQADITYHVTIPAIEDVSVDLVPPWVLVYDHGYSGLGQRYVNHVGEQHLINFVAMIITHPSDGGTYNVRDRITDRLLGFQADPSYGMTELVSMEPIETEGNSNFALWRGEFQTYQLNYGEGQS